jgi:hypothetical protein
MNAQVPDVRTPTAVLAAIIVAAIAVAGCAVVAIAYMLGILGPHAPLPGPPISTASPAQQPAGSAPGLVLLPGETLVTPEAAPAPTPKPMAAAPQSPTSQPAAPVARPALQPAPRPSPSAAPRPVTPSYARVAPMEAAQPQAPAAPVETVCMNCGTVVSTGVSGDQWEVRVRFDDGTARLLMYPTPPPFRNGQKVRFEDGRLVRNY